MSFPQKLPQINEKEIKELSIGVSGYTTHEKNEILHYHSKVKSETNKKKTAITQKKIWKRSEPAEFTISNFTKTLKGTTALVTEINTSNTDLEHNQIRSIRKNTFFNHAQKQTIEMALEIVNVRKREKENAILNMKKKESIVNTLNKTKDVFLLKTSAKIIDQEINKLDDTLAKEREEISM